MAETTVEVGDTFEHASERGRAYEVTANRGGGVFGLWTGGSLTGSPDLSTAAELLDPAGPWRRCDVRSAPCLRRLTNDEAAAVTPLGTAAIDAALAAGWAEAST